MVWVYTPVFNTNHKSSAILALDCTWLYVTNQLNEAASKTCTTTSMVLTKDAEINYTSPKSYDVYEPGIAYYSVRWQIPACYGSCGMSSVKRVFAPKSTLSAKRNGSFRAIGQRKTARRNVTWSKRIKCRTPPSVVLSLCSFFMDARITC